MNNKKAHNPLLTELKAIRKLLREIRDNLDPDSGTEVIGFTFEPEDEDAPTPDEFDRRSR